jgi:tetratricopeptide (TPR) repeat protein
MSPGLQRSTAFLTAVFLASGTLAEPVVQNHTPSATRTNEDARSIYQRGVLAYAAGRYADAVELFRDADRREPSAAFSFNMARAYEKLGDDAGALRSYRDYLRRAKNPDDGAEVRRLVESFSNRLAARGVQQVTIISTPPGATVVLDAEPVGVTPWTAELTPGAHTAALHLGGRVDVVRRFQVPVNDAIDVQVALQTEPTRTPESTAIARHGTPGSLETPPQRPLSQPARPLRTVGIVAMSAGGAALGGALAFELLRRDAEQKAHSEHEQIRFAQDIDTMESRRTAARVLGGVGAGLAAIGGVLFFLHPSEPPAQDRAAQLKLNVTTTTVAGWVSGRF